MDEKLLEVCIDSVESAEAAARGGADRIELCSALVIGGLSPSPALYRAVRAAAPGVAIRAMVRPRFGDFLYTAAEKSVMLDEARAWAAAGADGVVCGALNADGSLDRAFLKEIVCATPGIGHTLHRAFDVGADARKALEDAVECGFDTILTSGQRAGCAEGAKLIGELVRQAAGRIAILAGAGVGAAVIPDLAARAGVRQFHLSAKTTLQSAMAFRREGVPMGLPGFSEYEKWQTDEAKVRSARLALDSI